MTLRWVGRWGTTVELEQPESRVRGVHSARGVLETPDGGYEVVLLHEDMRLGPSEGGAPDGASELPEVGPVCDMIAHEVVGMLHAEPREDGPAWYWERA